MEARKMMKTLMIQLMVLNFIILYVKCSIHKQKVCQITAEDLTSQKLKKHYGAFFTLKL